MREEKRRDDFRDEEAKGDVKLVETGRLLGNQEKDVENETNRANCSSMTLSCFLERGSAPESLVVGKEEKEDDKEVPRLSEA